VEIDQKYNRRRYNDVKRLCVHFENFTFANSIRIAARKTKQRISKLQQFLRRKAVVRRGTVSDIYVSTIK